MTKTNKKILTLICFLLMLISMLFSCIMPIFVYAEEIGGSEFNKINVLDDLKSSNEFNINSYPFDKSGLFKRPEIMNVVEYCYSPRINMQNNYGLYLYFYNPQALDIVADSATNKVQIATSYKIDGMGNKVPNGYDKFDLQFCNTSVAPGYHKLFYKFKVVDKKGADGKKIVERVNSNVRQYDISGIELVTKGNSNAIEYTVGGSYSFKGFAKGYGLDINAESTLTCSVQDLETIRLDIAGKDDGVDKRTVWRSTSSSLGKNHQNQINSVFFAIDKKVLEKYGYILQRIKAEWWEYRTRPTVVIDDLGIYNSLAKSVGKKLTGYDLSREYSLMNKTGNAGGSEPTYYCDWSWNCNYITGRPFKVITKDKDELLPLLFYTNGAKVQNYTLSASTLEQYLKTYTKSYDNGRLEFNGHTYSRDLFESHPEKGRTIGYNNRVFDISNKEDFINLKDYDSVNNSWQKLLDYGWKSVKTSEDYKDVPPIQMVTAEDMDNTDLANSLKIAPNDVDKFKSYYNSVKKDSEVFIFHYAQTDYTAFDLEVAQVEKISTNKDIAELRQGTQFFDFDILEFTFNKDGVYTVIPVVSSPVDHISSYTPSVDGEKNDWWKKLLMILAIILLFVILMPLLPFIVQLLVWLICLPFKLIGAIFKGFGKLFKHKKRE